MPIFASSPLASSASASSSPGMKRRTARRAKARFRNGAASHGLRDNRNRTDRESPIQAPLGSGRNFARTSESGDMVGRAVGERLNGAGRLTAAAGHETRAIADEEV